MSDKNTSDKPKIKIAPQVTPDLVKIQEDVKESAYQEVLQEMKQKIKDQLKVQIRKEIEASLADSVEKTTANFTMRMAFVPSKGAPLPQPYYRAKQVCEEIVPLEVIKKLHKMKVLDIASLDGNRYEID